LAAAKLAGPVIASKNPAAIAADATLIVLVSMCIGPGHIIVL